VVEGVGDGAALDVLIRGGLKVLAK
jgi:hypothetical protein